MGHAPFRDFEDLQGQGEGAKAKNEIINAVIQRVNGELIIRNSNWLKDKIERSTRKSKSGEANEPSQSGGPDLTRFPNRAKSAGVLICNPRFASPDFHRMYWDFVKL